MTGKTAEETEGDKAGRKGESESVAATGPRGITSEETMELPWWSSGQDSKLPLAGDAAPSPGGGTKIPYTTHHHRLPPQKVRRL